METDYQNNKVTVTFDDEKTNVDEMIEALEEEDFPVKGKPKFIS